MEGMMQVDSGSRGNNDRDSDHDDELPHTRTWTPRERQLLLQAVTETNGAMTPALFWQYVAEKLGRDADTGHLRRSEQACRMHWDRWTSRELGLVPMLPMNPTPKALAKWTPAANTLLVKHVHTQLQKTNSALPMSAVTLEQVMIQFLHDWHAVFGHSRMSSAAVYAQLQRHHAYLWQPPQPHQQQQQKQASSYEQEENDPLAMPVVAGGTAAFIVGSAKADLPPQADNNATMTRVEDAVSDAQLIQECAREKVDTVIRRLNRDDLDGNWLASMKHAMASPHRIFVLHVVNRQTRRFSSPDEDGVFGVYNLPVCTASDRICPFLTKLASRDDEATLVFIRLFVTRLLGPFKQAPLATSMTILMNESIDNLVILFVPPIVVQRGQSESAGVVVRRFHHDLQSDGVF